MSTAKLTFGSTGWFTAYWITMRPYLLFVSGAAGLVGVALSPGRTLVYQLAAFAPLFLAYGLGQALTDTFQTDTDAISAPYRPLVRGDISIRSVRWMSLLGLLISAGLLCLMSAWVLLPASLAVAGLLAYTPCKRRHWAGPACNSLVVALLPLISRTALAESGVEVLCDLQAIAASVSVFGSYAVFVIIGYLKDVEADRRTGYDTLPVHFGPRFAVLVSAAYAVVGAIGSLALMVPQLLHVRPFSSTIGAGLCIWCFGFTATIVCHGLAWSVTRDDQAHHAIAWSVRAFLALHIGESILLNHSVLPLGLLLLLAFELALALRPARNQI